MRIYFLIALFCILTACAQNAPSTDFAAQIKTYASEKSWNNTGDRKLSKEDLVKSIELARGYYLNNQFKDGSFMYVHYLQRENPKENLVNGVRQAGSLWGLASLFRERPTYATQQAVMHSMDYFIRNEQVFNELPKAPYLKEEKAVSTGMVALFGLSIVEFFRFAEKDFNDETRKFYTDQLDMCIKYLQKLEREDGSWSSLYFPQTGKILTDASPYYDGECLLFYVKAARYMNRKELIPRIEKSAPLLARRYTTEAWEEDPFSSATKGFYQWGCMAFAECVEQGWGDKAVLSDSALAMSWWMINCHQIYKRTGHTAYAAEGLLSCIKIARITGNKAAEQPLENAAREVIKHCLSLQIGSPWSFDNPVLSRFNRPSRILGGVANNIRASNIRIDTVQHHTHALLLALEVLYPEKS